jgi:RNA polymerase sigma-70 factor (ECF subfamily)
MGQDSVDRTNEPGASTPPEAARYFDRGRAAWPDLVLELGMFESYFSRHAVAGPVEAHAADMYFACACANDVPGALQAFEKQLVGAIARAVASQRSSRAFVEEVLQSTREKLFVRRGPQLGKIADYGGRASLRAWLCAVAVRVAMSLRRRRGERLDPRIGIRPDKRLASAGPEIEYMRGRYKRAFEDAVGVAVGQLPSKERALLRLNLVDGMSVDVLAKVYDVGRSTAARWLANARRTLLALARREMRQKLHLTSTELDSLAAPMRSQLEVSILRLLANGGDDEDEGRPTR